MKDVAARNHVGLHAGMRAQHAGHVLCLCAHDGGGGFIPMLGNPAASRHGGRLNRFPSNESRAFVHEESGRRNTEGDAFKRPPLSVALLMVDRSYFFFAAFFAGAFLAAAFFAGAFLAAFLVAILPILPFRWFASIAAMIKLQLMNV
jgi:hypothetical protein